MISLYIETCSFQKRTCHCDSGLSTSDSGILEHKEYLPVMAVYFGDTGTTTDAKVGNFKVGKLKCRGDSMYKKYNFFYIICLNYCKQGKKKLFFNI